MRYIPSPFQIWQFILSVLKRNTASPFPYEIVSPSFIILNSLFTPLSFSNYPFSFRSTTSEDQNDQTPLVASAERKRRFRTDERMCFQKFWLSSRYNNLKHFPAIISLHKCTIILQTEYVDFNPGFHIAKSGGVIPDNVFTVFEILIISFPILCFQKRLRSFMIIKRKNEWLVRRETAN